MSNDEPKELKPSAREIFAQTQAATARSENKIAGKATERMAKFIQDFYDQREEDLLSVIREHLDEIDGDLSKLKVIFQNEPEGIHTRYRGIQLNGRLVVDHYTDWPLKEDEQYEGVIG